MTRRTIGMRWRDAVLCRVDAIPRSGVICPVIFPLPLDGILASAQRRRTLGASYGSVVDHHVVDLPLARITRGTAWVWAATCAQFTGQAEQTRWIHQRFNATEAEGIVAKLPPNTDIGLTKAWRIPQPVTVASRITWWCAGDPGAIERLLGDVWQIGADRGSGEGVIARWTVTEAGALQWDGHLPDRRLIRTETGAPARPFPTRIDNLGFGPGTIPHAIRPPYWRAPLRNDGGMNERRHHDVYAPWAIGATITDINEASR